MHIGEFGLVSANRLNAGRSFPQNKSLSSGQRPVQQIKLPAEEQQNGLSKDIKDAINSSLVHKLFSALSRSKSSLFKNYNSDIDALQIHRSTKEDSLSDPVNVDLSEFSYFDLSLNLGPVSFDSESLILDLSFSQTASFETSISVSDISIAFNVTQTSVQSLSLELDITTEQQQADPLILDLDFDGFSFSSNSQKVDFDLNADGQLDSISGLEGRDAFLAFDINKNGQIDNGMELFGDAGGAKDGFAELRSFDLNGDSQIDAQDRIFDQLLLLSFADNGAQQINRLSEQNIQSISLESNQENTNYKNANQLVASSTFENNNGDKGMVGDFLLGIGIS